MNRPGPARPTLAIFWISVLGLYLELLLIRWVGTEIRIFAYLQNTVLVVCFLGLSVGMWTVQRPIAFGRMLASLLVLAAMLAIPATRDGLTSISDLLNVLGDVNIWTELKATQSSPLASAVSVAIGLTLTLVIMLLVLEMFIPVGRLLGRLMNGHPRPILAYSVNLAGSLVGTWLFVALSVMAQPPLTWFAVLLLLLLPAVLQPAWLGVGQRSWLQFAAAAALVGCSWLAGRTETALEIVWSPYQKLAIVDGPSARTAGEEGSLFLDLIRVNNAGYQAICDLRPGTVAAHPELYDPAQAGLSQYDLPSLMHPRPRRMLIVGAGSGNDAAGALRNGVEHVTAVEIDPVIIDFGRRYHPEQPYQSPAVTVVIDDARAFFASTSERFDVISFGLLDSHTTTAMMNARLDHYVYTRESIERAKELLEPGGVICLSFEALKPFIADRMAVVLTDVFGEPPLVFRVPYNRYGWGGVFFVAGDLGVARSQIAADPRLSAAIDVWNAEHPMVLAGTARPTTDDWPYLYLSSPRIPPLHLLLAGLMGVLVLWLVKVRKVFVGSKPFAWGRSHWHFFFLGAAFLLLEVQGISRASVALGNTWLVNAVIISAVLAMVLLANVIASSWPRLPSLLVYVLLCSLTLGLYFVDLARFAALPFATKALVVGGLTTLPMLFSGVAFVRPFVAAADKDRALGANLIGALAGALLASISFLTGTKSLLLVVAGFYILAALTRPRADSQSA